MCVFLHLSQPPSPHSRGLCTILRTAAGGQNRVADFDVPEYKNNSHWVLPDGGAAEDSNYVCYYDAASLYPSSGKTKFVFFWRTRRPFWLESQPPLPTGDCRPAARAGAGPLGPATYKTYHTKSTFFSPFFDRIVRPACGHRIPVCDQPRESDQIDQRK